MMQISNAIVIGAGIGGLAVATALAQRGVAVTVIERAPAIREVGAGLQISPNGGAVLRALGIRDLRKMRARAVVLRAFDRPERDVVRLDLGAHAPDLEYAFVHRSDLIDALAAAARQANVTLELGAEAAEVLPGETPRLRMADGTLRRAELIIGADGLHSIARPALNGADKAKFTGQVAWRAVIPNKVDHPAEAWVHMGAKRHLVSYPLRGGKLVNLVAVEERADWAAEGWNHVDDPARLRAAFAGFGGAAGQMLNAVDAVTLWGLHRHPVAPNWHAGGVVLLGDAAHPTLPFLAQGANMALEDAWVLADTLERGQGVDTYQNRRQSRVLKIITAANRNAWRYHLPPGPIRWAAHHALHLGSRAAPRRMVGAFDWIYRHDVTRR